MEQIEEKEAIKQFNVPLPSYLIDKIEDYQKSNEIKNRTKALEEILYKAFETEKQDADSYRYETIERNKPPSFIFTDTANNQEIYNYLKQNPNASRFIFRKYKLNREFIKEISDPENPIYIEKVADTLKDTFQISEMTEDIHTLEEKRALLQSDLNSLEDVIKEKTIEYERLETNIPELSAQLDGLRRQLANLTTDEAMNRIKSFYESVSKFIETAFEAQKKLSISESINSMRLDMNQINTLKLLAEKAKNDMKFITDEDLISESHLDEMRKKIKEDMEREKEDGLRAMDSLIIYNPRKALSKSLERIDLVAKQLSQGMPMDGNTVGFYMSGINTISENLAVPRQLIGNLLGQIENVERREKK